MSSKYQRQIDLAYRTIVKYGQTVTWTKQAESVADSTKPWKTSAAEPQEYQVSVLFLRPSGGLARALYHLIKGTDAPSGAPRGLMAAKLDFTPEITDTVTRNGSVLVISSLNPVAPAEDVILWDIEFA